MICAHSIICPPPPPPQKKITKITPIRQKKELPSLANTAILHTCYANVLCLLGDLVCDNNRGYSSALGFYAY